LHQRIAENSDPFLWAEGIPGAKMIMMSVQYGNSDVSQRIVYEWIERFKNVHTNVKHGEGNGHQSTFFTEADMDCKLVMIQPMKGMPSIKSVHDGFQSNSQNCTKRNIWTFANCFWIAMVLKVTTWKESSLEMKLGPTITNQRVNTRVLIGNIVIQPPR